MKGEWPPKMALGGLACRQSPAVALFALFALQGVGLVGRSVAIQLGNEHCPFTM